MERCHEISQWAPIIADVTARTEHQMYQGTVVERVRVRTGAATVELISYPMVNPAGTGADLPVGATSR